MLLCAVVWLEHYPSAAGASVLLELEDLDAKGWAEVLEIGPCPEIVPGPGSVVTATFAHQPTSEILDVTISVARQSPGGLTLDQPSIQDTSSPASETIGVTANHPFWSVDHQAFGPVGLLEPGTRVKTHLDQIQTIVSLHPRPGPPEQVYNLEVHGEHVYYVGQSSVLVHNQCFWTVQDAGDAARLRSGNGVWPNSPSRSALGEGVYAFDNLEDALRYQKRLSELHGIETTVVKFRVDDKVISSFKRFDVDSLGDASDWMNKHSKL